MNIQNNNYVFEYMTYIKINELSIPPKCCSDLTLNYYLFDILMLMTAVTIHYYDFEGQQHWVVKCVIISLMKI